MSNCEFHIHHRDAEVIQSAEDSLIKISLLRGLRVSAEIFSLDDWNDWNVWNDWNPRNAVVFVPLRWVSVLRLERLEHVPAGWRF